jgi:hypothetical protein
MPHVPRAEQPALRIEQREEEVSSVEWQKGGNAASAAMPRGMAIASAIVSTFIGICCLSYVLRIASREI